jgi:hypothetical protein
MKLWNQGNPHGYKALSMYWSIDPPAIRGVLGQVRTALTELVAELQSEVGDSGGLPSAVRTDEAVQAAVPWIITDSTVTIMTTKDGDSCRAARAPRSRT